MTTSINYPQLSRQIEQWAKSLGFDAVGIADIELSEHETYLNKWLEQGWHGEMDYMQRHGQKRSRPDLLVEGTRRVITVRMDYAPADITKAESVLNKSNTAYISRYALGRDYHKVLRNKLQKLAEMIEHEVGALGYRVFTDSAPVLEKALAEKSGLGWIGKHTNLIDKNSGSWFFLGEIYVDLPLPTTGKSANHCGSCQACIDICPTKAIVAPYQLDARLCISYLTIELKGPIPVELRRQIGNRIYGCDDCQLVCPWNKFAQPAREPDFSPRARLTDRKLIELFNWSKEEFLSKTAGSAIRRIGYQSWLRNIAVALGNAETDPAINAALSKKLTASTPLVREHIEWALAQHSDCGETN